MNALVPVTAAMSMTVSDVEKVAVAIAKGGLFGSRDPNAVLTLCLLAQAEGQHPAVVFRDYHIISGKPAKKAEAMLRDFINAGGKIEWHELTDQVADATFSHPSGGSARISWDHKRASTAGIAGNAMYKKYPRQMLRSRTVSEGVRTVYPGATSGLYVPEEVNGFDDRDTPQPEAGSDNGQVVDVTPTTIETGEKAEPIKGIHKIKERLRVMMTAGDQTTTLAAFKELKRANKDDLKTIRDAGHSWWTGDGEDFEGFGPWLARREAELDPDCSVNRALADMRETAGTPEALDAWREANSAYLEELDGADARRFQAAFDAHAADLADRCVGAG
jgi:hypothetical protein